MRRFLRLPWFLLLVVLVFWLLLHIPGYTRSGSDPEETISLGKLVVDTVDLPVHLGGLVVMLLVGRWRGTRAAVRFLLGLTGAEGQAAPDEARASMYRAASRTLAAGARGILWGAFLLNAVYLISFYWPDPPGLLTYSSRLTPLKIGALPAVLLCCLLLLPAADRADELAGRVSSSATRAAHAVDAIALIGLFVCSFVLIMSVFFYRYEILGVPGSGQTHITPNFRGVDIPFVLWSLGITIFLPWVALFPMLGGGAVARAVRNPGDDHSAILFRRIARSTFAVGVLTAVLVETAGLHRIAISGGNANPAEVQPLGGNMLVTLGVGLLVALVVGFGPPLLAKRRAAPGPAPEAT